MADSSSSLLLDELFEAGDPRLLDEIRACVSETRLGALAERWFKDPRPAMRFALLSYLDECCALPHHQQLVKRLFKAAEKASDDEAMAHFACAFDRWSRRYLITRSRYDWKSRSTFAETRLVYDKKVPTRAPKSRQGRNPRTGEPITLSGNTIEVFARRTREYLARRAFRYFRVLGLRDPVRYRRAMAIALPLYQDDQLQSPEQLLDAWSLCHILYGRSQILDRQPGGIRLAEGRSLKELEPAPMFEDAWWDGAFDDLLGLVEHARCRTVRSWSLSMLRRHHAEPLKNLPLSRIRRMLRSPIEELQTLGAELLERAPGLDTLPIAEWLELLKMESATILPMVCELVKAHVSPNRLDLAQCVELACSGAAPVAELGLAWAKAKAVRGAGDLATISKLSTARAPSVRAEAIAWVAGLLKQSKETTPEQVRDLFDARFADVRSAGLELMLEDERFKDLPQLWTALAESPFDDVRGVLVKHLEERAKSFGPETLRHIWATTLLAVHRGGKAKRLVTGQLAERIVKSPGEAGALLPLLGIALRSIRAPERRAALAAISQAAFKAPALREAIGKALPELKLFAAEAA